MKEEKPEPKVEPKVESKMKEEEPLVKEVSQDEIFEKAHQLCQLLGYELPEALRVAQTYPDFSLDELINFCFDEKAHQ